MRSTLHAQSDRQRRHLGQPVSVKIQIADNWYDGSRNTNGVFPGRPTRHVLPRSNRKGYRVGIVSLSKFTIRAKETSRLASELWIRRSLQGSTAQLAFQLCRNYCYECMTYKFNLKKLNTIFWHIAVTLRTLSMQ